tara:strand:+ start:1032 stop:2351 length:1320 start_codon:yes stop_codon:yes gene_type:complete
MKIFFFLFIFIYLSSCSFDNKTGIWTNENNVSENDDIFKEFKKISSTTDVYNKTIPLKNNFNFNITTPLDNSNWEDIYYDKNNNFINFAYNDLNKIIYKSKKLSKHQINSHVLVQENNLFINDDSGNIIIFSIDDNTIFKFNFYKKKYKKLKKKINFIVEKNIIYVGDNFGYTYAYDYISDKIIWAKNYKIPFRSNLKILKDKIVLSNQQNSLLFLDKKNGNLLSLIPTEETTIQNDFINNISINNNNILFLNSFGSLYSINSENMRLNWFLNLNKTYNPSTSNLFFGNRIINHNNIIVASSNQNTYLVDAGTGAIRKIFNFSSSLKPIINKDYLFMITKNNFLLSIDLITNKILYSYDISKEVAKYLNTKKKKLTFHEFMLINNELVIFLKNSFNLKFNINGQLNIIRKLPLSINSTPIVLNKSILYIDNKNKLAIIN